MNGSSTPERSNSTVNFGIMNVTAKKKAIVRATITIMGYLIALFILFLTDSSCSIKSLSLFSTSSSTPALSPARTILTYRFENVDLCFKRESEKLTPALTSVMSDPIMPLNFSSSV